MHAPYDENVSDYQRVKGNKSFSCGKLLLPHLTPCQKHPYAH